MRNSCARPPLFTSRQRWLIPINHTEIIDTNKSVPAKRLQIGSWIPLLPTALKFWLFTLNKIIFLLNNYRLHVSQPPCWPTFFFVPSSADWHTCFHSAIDTPVARLQQSAPALWSCSSALTVWQFVFSHTQAEAGSLLRPSFSCLPRSSTDHLVLIPRLPRTLSPPVHPVLITVSSTCNQA